MSPITIVLNSQKSLACVTAAVQSSMLNVHASAEPDQPLQLPCLKPTADFIQVQSHSCERAGLFPCRFIHTVKGTLIGGI